MLNVTTDYAVRIVLYLATKQKITNSNEIAKAMGIPPSYIMKITRKLKLAGIVSEKRGVAGGFVLIRAPEELTLLEIVSALEKTTNINRCLEEDGYCSRNAASFCTVRRLLARLQAQLNEGLSVKISELL